MKSFIERDKENKGEYVKLLTAFARLSGLFSDSKTPYINYRIAENVFCKSFQAKNLSRSDTAFDAGLGDLGIGLKTFICNSSYSIEKIAEFNAVAKALKELKGKSLAIELAKYRNLRIEVARSTYNIKNSIYHIVARKENELILFETDYDLIDIKNIKILKSNDTTFQFDDGKNFYSFNYSKSTLYRKFNIPKNSYKLKVEIEKDPYDLILGLFDKVKRNEILVPNKKPLDYVVLPLYGFRKKQKFIFDKSGLNQWNANGRKRNPGEVYIIVPAEIHKKYPDFFPKRDKEFKLQVPTGEIFNAKLCQAGSKALMTNPNKALSDWLLRRVLKLKEGELATIEYLNSLGIDSVIIEKDAKGLFKIDFMKTDSYEDFISK